MLKLHYSYKIKTKLYFKVASLHDIGNFIFDILPLNLEEENEIKRNSYNSYKNYHIVFRRPLKTQNEFSYRIDDIKDYELFKSNKGL